MYLCVCVCVCVCVWESACTHMRIQTHFHIPTKVKRDKITARFKGKKKSHFQTILNWESNPICNLNYIPK